MIIAVDFDGTCVTHEFPEVGRDIGAAPVLQDLVRNGHQLILYTVRSFLSNDEEFSGGLPEAIEWFGKNGIPLFGINNNPEQAAWSSSPKVYCHLVIDDINLGTPLIYPIDGGRPYVDWVKVRKMLCKLGIL